MEWSHLRVNVANYLIASLAVADLLVAAHTPLNTNHALLVAVLVMPNTRDPPSRCPGDTTTPWTILVTTLVMPRHQGPS